MYKNYPSYMLFKKKKIQEGKRIKRKNKLSRSCQYFSQNPTGGNTSSNTREGKQSIPHKE